MTKSPSISQLIKTAANKDQSFFLNENIIKVMCLKCNTVPLRLRERERLNDTMRNLRFWIPFHNAFQSRFRNGTESINGTRYLAGYRSNCVRITASEKVADI